VGKVLKKLYIDSAMKHGERLDREHEAEKITPIQGKSISWANYKKMQ
jgi:hypothetical protein